MNPLVAGVAAMAGVVAASNFLVQIQINDWLTWGALSYPIAFLVTDLINRRVGPDAARRVVYVGFACGVVLSLYTSTVRIALASGTAFLLAQLADVWLYDRLRRRTAWWRAPLISSTVASALDTALFFSLAFALTEVPWVTSGHRRLRSEDCGRVRHAGPVPAPDGQTRSRGNGWRVANPRDLIEKEADRGSPSPPAGAHVPIETLRTCAAASPPASPAVARNAGSSRIRMRLRCTSISPASCWRDSDRLTVSTASTR